MEEERSAHREGLAYVCAADCGTQITANAAGEGGPISCCGQPMRRGRVLRVAPRQIGASSEPRPATAYRVFADEEDFDALVTRRDDRLVMVEFSAPWCAACKAMDRLLSVPCLLLLRKGREVGRIFGQVGKGKIVEELDRRLAEA